MIKDVLIFLKSQLNEFLNTRSGWSAGESGEDEDALLDGEKTNPITFKSGAVTALLINLEEENTMRPAEPYRRGLMDGGILSVRPEIRLNLYVLFVARFKQYEQGLQALSLIIRYFQNYRVLDHENAPALPDHIDRLVVELVTLPFSEQNEIWNSLRTTYHPSLLYKVSLVVFRDEEGLALPKVTEPILRTVQ